MLFFLVVWCAAASAAAQTGPAPLGSRAIVLPSTLVHAESPAQQLAALQRWTHDYTEWKAWFLKYRSVPQPGLLSSRPRRPLPVPPPWLADMCGGSLIVDTGALADACRAFADWSAGDEAAEVITQQVAQARTKQEKPQKTLWWERIHVDAGWPMTQTGSGSFGVAGMHTTMHVTGRFQVFLTPGMIVMRVPSVEGGKTWSAATDWGFSYRLLDFRMPAMNRASSLHFNIVRVWVLGQNAIQSPGEMYLAGFSITFKKK